MNTTSNAQASHQIRDTQWIPVSLQTQDDEKWIRIAIVMYARRARACVYFCCRINYYGSVCVCNFIFGLLRLELQQQRRLPYFSSSLVCAFRLLYYYTNLIKAPVISFPSSVFLCVPFFIYIFRISERKKMKKRFDYQFLWVHSNRNLISGRTFLSLAHT